ncbi:DUF2235 domain-containing protein [Pseudomonas sp. UL073]|uniref:DUF2235 domain-containing protein n=1 Tax=Zestomonas insulae TaxID=2809017 RepID=A0ABS2IHP9_9GAMM|nr:DUF2235 domain-containing protein [Pseudomonas insulae]
MPNVCRPAAANTPPSARLRGVSAPAPSRPASRWDDADTSGHERVAAPAKTAVALRIGVFFDGTGNNASNSALGQLCGAQHPISAEDLDASCKPYMRDPDSSYGNDVTNVKKLSELYFSQVMIESDSGQQQAYRKIYVEGIGTSAGKEDPLLGAGLGRGSTGVAGRVQSVFSDIQVLVKEFHQSHPDCEIASLTFDAFGFSRGAAAARHFANEVACGGQGPLQQTTESMAPAFKPSFIDRYQQDIHVGFIGLFDTVASVGGLSNLGNVRSASAPGLKLHLPRRLFANVVHLVARDEHRANFPLCRVKPDHPEISLPGAHSDIGGGYLSEAQECLLISPMQAQDVALHTDVKSTAIYQAAVREKARWLAQGWPAAMLEIVTPPAKPLPAERNAARQKRVYAALQLKRPVRGELSRVYLRVMYQLAKQKGVRFNVIDDHDPGYALPAELNALCARFVSGNYSVTPDEEQLLKLRYIHCSANWNPPAKLQGQTPRTGINLQFVNAPTTDAVRVQHPHTPDSELP